MAQSEMAFQQQCVMWYHNQYPELRGLLFMVHNNARTKREGALLKAIGLVAGVSDLIFVYDGFAYFIELKTPTGYQSIEQKNWQELIENQGCDYYVINSFEKFKDLIIKIIER